MLGLVDLVASGVRGSFSTGAGRCVGVLGNAYKLSISLEGRADEARLEVK